MTTSPRQIQRRVPVTQPRAISSSWNLLLAAGLAIFALVPAATPQSADWQTGMWRDPQVRYLLADLTGGGKTELYRKYATEERDPDSREAMRLWDAGVQVINMAEFERKWVTNRFGKDGRVFRVVFRGTDRTILGNEVILSNDGELPQGHLRLALLDLTLGMSPDSLRKEGPPNPVTVEALRRFAAGCRVSNSQQFERKDGRLVFRGSGHPADPALVRLNSDVPWPEVNVRYFMTDIALGGSLEFYRQAAQSAHEMGCLEAVRRTEEGYKITNLSDFERKQVNGQTLITRKGSNDRISGRMVTLSSD